MSGLDYLKKFLTDEGYKYTDNGGHISFKYQGTQFVAFNNSDSPYLQITILFYDVNDENRYRVLRTCNKINTDKFCVKMTADDDSVWCNYEFKPTDDTTAADFDSILNIMQQTYATFYDEIEKE